MVVGYALKVTPFIKDWMIIWVLLICGVIASGLRLGFDVNGIANGLIAAGAAITTHQFFKQSIQKKK
ncbi:hypothetical protein BFG57_01655 [Bacillus solimangrovi]|uniref:Holin n=2 Tax=Bacillus solimangrovi TaxID=1305675 RepID=A0A1E5LFJ5_9BACI|nr:hypothetical protein BFG57_01655 [Bacillus solimangrovi]